MWWLRYGTKPHEILQCSPEIGYPRKLIGRYRHGPFVPIALTVDVEVRAGNLFIIGISVWGTTEVQPHQDHDLPGSVLILAF